MACRMRISSNCIQDFEQLHSDVRAAYRILLRWASPRTVGSLFPRAPAGQTAFAVQAFCAKRYFRQKESREGYVIVDGCYTLELLSESLNSSFYLSTENFMMLAGAADVTIQSLDDCTTAKAAEIERVVRPHQDIMMQIWSGEGNGVIKFFQLAQALSRAIKAAAPPNPGGGGSVPPPVVAPPPPPDVKEEAFQALVSKVADGDDEQEFILTAIASIDMGDLCSLNFKSLKEQNHDAAKGCAVKAVRDLIARELEWGYAPEQFAPDEDGIVGIVTSVGDMVARAKRSAAAGKKPHSASASSVPAGGVARSLRTEVYTSTDSSKLIAPVSKADQLDDVDILSPGALSFIGSLPPPQTLSDNLRELTARIEGLQSHIVTAEHLRLMRKGLTKQIARSAEGENLAQTRTEFARLMAAIIDQSSKAHFTLSDGISLSSANMTGLLSGVIWYTPPSGASVSQSFDFGPQIFWPPRADFPPISTPNFLWAFDKLCAFTLWWDTLKFFADMFTIANPASHMKEWVDGLHVEYKEQQIYQIKSLQQSFIDDLGLKIAVFSKLQYNAIYGSRQELPNFLTIHTSPEFAQFQPQNLALMSSCLMPRLSPLSHVPILVSDRDKAPPKQSVKQMPLTVAQAYSGAHFQVIPTSPRTGLGTPSPFGAQSPIVGARREESPAARPPRQDTPANGEPNYAGLVKDYLLKDPDILRAEQTTDWTKWITLRGFCRRGVVSKRGCTWPGCGFCNKFSTTMSTVDMNQLEADLMGYLACSAQDLTLPGRQRARSLSWDSKRSAQDGGASAAQAGAKRPASRDGGRSPGGRPGAPSPKKP